LRNCIRRCLNFGGIWAHPILSELNDGAIFDLEGMRLAFSTDSYTAVDKIFINTSGIGRIPAKVSIASHNAKPGDMIIISGTIADHGITILTQREGLSFDLPLTSDTAPLNHMVNEMFAVSTDIRADTNRGQSHRGYAGGGTTS
jgi:hydrogenase maturation factor